MPAAELVPLGVAALSAVVALVTYIFGPSWKARIEGRARQESHGQEGWTKAVKALEDKAEAFEARADELESQVKNLTEQVHHLSRQVTERDELLAQQSRSLTRANGRIRQLEHAWPSGHSMPEPDPAHQP